MIFSEAPLRRLLPHPISRSVWRASLSWPGSLSPGRLPLFLLAALWGCEAPEPPELRIGLLALSGDRYWESSGAPSVRGADLAEGEINEEGGVVVRGRHHRLRVIVRTYDPRPEAASTAARGLLNQDSVHALVGPQLSAHAIPVAVIAESARVPMISPMSTSPLTTRNKRFVFRLAAVDEAQAEGMARFALDSLKLERAAVLFDEADAYSRDLSKRFQRAFQEGGGRVVAAETYTTDRTDDFSEQLARIAATEPDALYLPNPAREDTLQLRQARELGIDAQILGTDTWDLRAFSEHPLAQGVIATHQWHFDLPHPEVGAFLDRFREEYGTEPRTTAAMTYDAIRILALAAERAGSLGPMPLRDAIASIDDYRGATGLVSFQGTQDPDRSITLSTIRDGEIVVLKSIDP